MNNEKKRRKKFAVLIIIVTITAAVLAFAIGYILTGNYEDNIFGFYSSTAENITNKIDSIRNEVLYELSNNSLNSIN